MNCPKCKTDFLSDDIFCAGCGLDLRTIGNRCQFCGEALQEDDIFCSNCGKQIETPAKKAETASYAADVQKAASPPRPPDVKEKVAEKIVATTKKPTPRKGETELDHTMLIYMAATTDHNILSPLSAPYYKSEGKPAYKGKMLDKSLAELIANPEKAYYLNTISREQDNSQNIFLMKGNKYHRWRVEDEHVWLAKEENPSTFIEHIFRELNQRINRSDSYTIVLNEKQTELLSGINQLCQGLERLKVSPAFILKSELKGLFGEEATLTAPLNELGQKGLIRLLGNKKKEQLITMAPAGQEIARVMGNADHFIHLMVLVAGKDRFPSMKLAATPEGIYLIEPSKDGETTMVRALNSAAIRSLLEWAWLAETTAEDIFPITSTEKTASTKATTKPSAPAEVKTAKTASKTTPSTGACPKCGAPIKEGASFCMKCGEKL